MCADKKTSMPVRVIGAGCAGLSLAARAADLPNHELSLIDQDVAVQADHIWGFWSMPWVRWVTPTARSQWSRWQIISHNKNVLHESDHYPYCAVHRHNWLQHCRSAAKAAGVQFVKQLTMDSPSQQILDSRPPPVPDDAMLQHFVGWELTAPKGTFDHTTAVLMDFRCDQSHGMHFIYCLPFSDRAALIESTLFSPKLVPADFYENAIITYLQTICNLHEYSVTRHESGVIPLGVFGRHDPALAGIGANGGAIRPSSGYAFSFIQKQIDHAVTNAVAGRPLPVGVPHSAFELWMDRIFLAVLRRRPELAPGIFTAMAASLTGDEFALFLSGEAGPKIWTKVILAMPKLPFLWGLLHPEPSVGR